MWVGIITIKDYKNYGNRFQNYAMCKLIENYGLKPLNVLFHTKNGMIERSRTQVRRLIKKVLPVPVIYLRQCHKEQKEKRSRNFRKFTEETMGKPLVIFAKQYEDIAGKIKEERFACFIAGSDQIWNPEFAGSERYFLTFAPPEKRIAFAASIGQSELPDEIKSRYAPMLKEMKYISVREETAASLVQEMTGRSPEVMPDPTLLLRRQQWEELARKPALSLPERYILVFFLGNLPGQAIRDFAARKRLPVIYLNHRDYQELFALGPAEFLYVMMHASYVLTDSFHGTVFSILFERQFFVFRRKEAGVKDMFSRLETLLQNFSLEEREQPWEGVKETSDILEREWEQACRKLEQERSRADKVLGRLLKADSSA
ncbi:MAG: polysaccharide pyruvyl transferase family protein [Lachnospiraceae bacterium]|nr:polysaccharide pyruvyl transferase family protein [Lachnospiraceae bacterium]